MLPHQQKENHQIREHPLQRGSGVSVSKQPIPLYHLVRTRDALIIFFEANKSDLLCIPGSCQAAGWMKFSCDPGGGSTK